MRAPVVVLDGTLTPPEEAVVSVFDRGFLYGDGVFTVLRGARGAPVELSAHLAQLAADAGLVGMEVPEGIERAVALALRALAVERARVRVIVSRGVGPLTARLAELRSRTIVTAEEAGPARTALRAVIVEEPRLVTSQRWAPKSLAYQASLLAKEEAAARGAEEALRLFDDGTVGEGATSNVFAVVAGEVITPPPRGIRPGVTRRKVLQLCAHLGIPAHERPLTRGELRGASEVFVTSSIGGVVPVVELDGEARGPAPLAHRLATAYEAAIAAG